MRQDCRDLLSSLFIWVRGPAPPDSQARPQDGICSSRLLNDFHGNYIIIYFIYIYKSFSHKVLWGHSNIVKTFQNAQIGAFSINLADGNCSRGWYRELWGPLCLWLACISRCMEKKTIQLNTHSLTLGVAVLLQFIKTKPLWLVRN